MKRKLAEGSWKALQPKKECKTLIVCLNKKRRKKEREGGEETAQTEDDNFFYKGSDYLQEKWEYYSTTAEIALPIELETAKNNNHYKQSKAKIVQ